MNDDLQTYIEPELEARIVALVLGEASAFEAEELERLISERPELKAYRTGLEKIDGIVSEAHREQEESEWKLSDVRRGKIQAKIDERKRRETVEARRKRISRIAQRRLIYTCAACLALTLVILVLSQPLGSEKELARMTLAETEKDEKSKGEIDLSAGSANFESAFKSVEESAQRRNDRRESVSLDASVLEKKQDAIFQKQKVAHAIAGLNSALSSGNDAVVIPNGGSVSVPTAMKELPAMIESGEASSGGFSGKPSAPKAVMSEAIAANTSSPAAVTAPQVAIPDPVSDFGDGSDFSDGFASFGGVGGGVIAGGGGENRPVARPDVAALGDAVVDGRKLNDGEATWDFELTDSNEPESFRFEEEERSVASREEKKSSISDLGEKDHRIAAKESGRNAGKDFAEGKAKDNNGRGEDAWGRPGDASAEKLGFPLSAATPVAESVNRDSGQDSKESSKKRIRFTHRAGVVDGGVATDGLAIPNDGQNPGGVSMPAQGAQVAVDEIESVESQPGIEQRKAGESTPRGGEVADEPAEEASKGGQELLEREMMRREAGVENADKRLIEGRQAYSNGDYESAVDKYREALKTLPHGTATKERREFLKKSLEDGAVALTQDYRRQGKYQEARELLEEIDKNDPGSIAAEKGLGYLDDPIRTEAGLTYEHAKNVDEIRGNLYKGESFYDLGLYDKAEEEFKNTLRIDPYNKAARRWMERTSAIKSDYYRAAYDQTRAEMLMKVDKAWKLPAPQDEDADGLVANDPFSEVKGGQSNFFETNDDDSDPFSAKEDQKIADPDPFAGEVEDQDKEAQLSLVEAQTIPLYGEFSDDEVKANENLDRLNQVIIPEVKLDNVTVKEAIEFIESRTRELDSTPRDGARKGVDIRVVSPGTLSANGEEGFGASLDLSRNKIKNLELKNVPARIALQYIADEAKLRYKVDENGVILLPITDGADADVKQRRWDISPEVANEIREATANGKSFETVLKEQGISFPQNASASFLGDDNILIARNTSTNLELLNGIVKAAEDFAEKKVKTRQAEWLLGEDMGSTKEVAKLKKISPKSKPITPKQVPVVASFETSTKEKTDSTFSLNVSDVSFKLAKAALSKETWPDASKVRPEEFVNALDYDDAKPTQNEKISCEIEQGSHPFMQQRNLMRVSMSTASLGRNAATPLRLTILLDQSGSMERADRAESVQKAFALLAAQLNPNDEVTLVGFARTPRLLAERVKGNEVAKLADFVANPLTEGGTNLEEALSTGLQLAKQQFLKGAQNRIILLTDGAANLGDAKPVNLASQVESMRRADIAFDACGVGADGLNDDVLSSLTKQGDGRYYFLDRPEDADDGFARQIAGALRPAAKNVKVQVLFNPDRVSTFKLYGFEKHKLKKEDFRNDSVDAAEMAAEESGVALYHFEPMPEGRGDIGTVSVRFLDTSSNQMVERTWAIPYQAEVAFFSKADPRLRLASVAALFAEKLKGSPVGDRVELKRLRQETQVLKPSFAHQARFNEFQTMLQQAGD